jgi:hypothetical protein
MNALFGWQLWLGRAFITLSTKDCKKKYSRNIFLLQIKQIDFADLSAQLKQNVKICYIKVRHRGRAVLAYLPSN